MQKKLFFSICLLIVMLSACQRHSSENRRVAVICSDDSLHANLTASDVQQVLKKMGGVKIQVSVYYLNANELSANECCRKVSNYLNRIAAWKPNLIMVNRDPALQALLTCGNEKAHQFDVLYAGINFPQWKLLSKYPNVRGFWEKPNYIANLNLIRSLMGEGRVHLLYNEDESAQKAYQAERESLDKVSYPFDISLIVHPKSLLTHRIDTLQHAFSIPFFRLKGYQVMNYYDRIKSNKHALLLDNSTPEYNQMAEVYAGPVFSAVSQTFYQSDEVIGGYLTTKEGLLRQWGSMAVDMLKGNPLPLSLTIEQEQQFVFHYNALHRWGISPSDLPPDSQVIGTPFLVHYGWVIMGVFIGMCVLLLVLLSVLKQYKNALNKKQHIKNAIQQTQDELLHRFGNKQNIFFTRVDNKVYFDSPFMELIHCHEPYIDIKELKPYIHPDNQRVLSLSRSAMGDSQDIVYNFRARFKSEEYEHYQIRCGFIKDSQKNMVIAGILINTEEAVQHREELKRTTELAKESLDKTSFFESVTHEIRTPLNAIMGFTDILASGEMIKIFSYDDLHMFVSEIQKNNDLLKSAINNIVEYARLLSGKMPFKIEKADLNEMAETAFVQCKSLVKPELSFTLNKAPMNINVEVDRDKLQMVMERLIRNANKFTEAGHIALYTIYDPLSHAACVVVEDTGCGISKEKQEFVMHSFFKVDTLTQGTGLGLTICDAIIKKLNGRITIESEEGKGSKFIVSLPSSLN